MVNSRKFQRADAEFLCMNYRR